MSRKPRPIIFEPLQNWQDANGVNDDALAAKIGVDRSTIFRAKRGDVTPRMETLIAIKRITGIQPAEWAAFRERVVRSKKNSRSALEEAA